MPQHVYDLGQPWLFIGDSAQTMPMSTEAIHAWPVRHGAYVAMGLHDPEPEAPNAEIDAGCKDAADAKKENLRSDQMHLVSYCLRS